MTCPSAPTGEAELAREYLRRWIGDAATVDEAVDRAAEHIVGLWSMIRRAEDDAVWWMNAAGGTRS